VPAVPGLDGVESASRSHLSPGLATLLLNRIEWAADFVVSCMVSLSLVLSAGHPPVEVNHQSNDKRMSWRGSQSAYLFAIRCCQAVLLRALRLAFCIYR
jgi:hypothetical protein